MNCPESSVHFCRCVPQTRRYSRIFVFVRWGGAGHNAQVLQSRNGLFRCESFDFKANHSGGKFVRHGRLQFDVGHLGQTFLALRVEFVNSRRDLRFSDLHMKAECLGQRPTMLERMEPGSCRLRNCC